MTTITQLSPGVAFREIDLTAFVPNVGTNQGAFVGQFNWGPVMYYQLVSSATDLANVFGKPTDSNYIDWFSASNYLAYTSNLLVTRVVDEESAFNAVAGIVLDDHDVDSLTPSIPKLFDYDNSDTQKGLYEVTAVTNKAGYYDFTVSYVSGVALTNTTSYNLQFYKEGQASYTRNDLSFTYDNTITDGDPGTGKFRVNDADIDSVTRISVDIKNNHPSNPKILSRYFEDLRTNLSTNPNERTYLIIDTQTPAIPAGILIKNYNHFKVLEGTNKSVLFAARYPGNKGNGIIVSMADRNTYATWEYAQYFDGTPGTSSFVRNLGGVDDEIHIIVIDGAGSFTGEKGAVLERFAFVSKASDARSLDGSPVFFGNVINEQSYYVWYLGPPPDSDLATNMCVSSVEILPEPMMDNGVPLLLSGDGYIASTDPDVDVLSIPAPSSGTQATGFFIANPTTGAIEGVRITNGGTGYTGTVTITITPTNLNPGVDFTATAVLDDGAIIDVEIDVAGSGYLGPTVIDFSDPGNSGQRAVGVLTIVGGSITAIDMVNPGSGYGSWDEIGFQIITRTGSGLEAEILEENVIDGSITEVTIKPELSETEFLGGTGYDDDNTSIIFDAPPTGGITALGSLIIENGVITGVTITRPGSGYLTTPGYTIARTFGTGAPTGTGFEGKVNVEDVNADDWGQTAVDTASGTPRSFAYLGKQFTRTLKYGSDGLVANANEIIEGWNLYRDAEETDVGLLFLGAPGGPNGGYDVFGNDYRKIIIQHVIDNVCTWRKDCICFLSPKLDDVLNRKQGDAALRVIKTRNALNRSSSYAIMDSGWKLQYDIYNDKYRWIPLNADVAGLCAQTDMTNDPWWSPAGYTRGNIKNCISLAFNPNKTSRDELYKNSINPVVTFTGDGTILYGDKTLQTRQSAFSWINVRRLFIVLEKAITKAAKYYLFEFNDHFTRVQFLSMVNPYLELVKNRRGLYDYHVVCDETNNTPEIIDRGEFVASIFLKPARSINFITLNFVAVRTGVEFSEVVNLV
jgi:hypothetical protein